jgi:hypothetical protein
MRSTGSRSTRRTELRRAARSGPSGGGLVRAALVTALAPEPARRLPRPPLTRRLGLGLGLLGGSAGLALLLAQLISSSLTSQTAGFVLPAAHACAKLDVSDAGAADPPAPTAVPPPPPAGRGPEPVLTEIPVPATKPPEAPAGGQGFVIPALPLEPSPAAPTAAATPPPAPAVAEAPAAEQCYECRRGDTPMTRTWKVLGFQTLLAATITTAPALGQAVDPPPGGGAKSTDQLRTDKKFDAQQEIKDLRDALSALKTTVEGLETKENATLREQALRADFRALKDEIEKLRKSVDALQARLSSTQTSAQYGPAALGNGRVQLVNEYPEQITIVVNDRSYRLLPGESRVTDAIPAGAFSYQILSVQAQPQNRTLAANETYTIRVYPR